MNYIKILLYIVTVIAFTSCATVEKPSGINLIPMYGHPNIEKTASQKKSDEKYIEAVSTSEGSRKNASKVVALEGWKSRSKGDSANAMRRFNQSWLLNPDYYQPYWGFGTLLLKKDTIDEAVKHFEKALSLIDKDGEKERLLTDTAGAYTIQAETAAKTDKVKSNNLYSKSNSLFNEAIKHNPSYGNAYRTWVISLYKQGNYVKALEMVKKAQETGARDLNPKFIENLTRKANESK